MTRLAAWIVLASLLAGCSILEPLLVPKLRPKQPQPGASPRPTPAPTPLPTPEPEKPPARAPAVDTAPRVLRVPANQRVAFTQIAYPDHPVGYRFELTSPGFFRVRQGRQVLREEAGDVFAGVAWAIRHRPTRYLFEFEGGPHASYVVARFVDVTTAPKPAPAW